MLILSRKIGEAIVITVPGFDPIVVTVTRIDRTKTSLGIAADRRIAVRRDELEPHESVQNDS